MKPEVLQFKAEETSNSLDQQGSGLTSTREKPITLEKVSSSMGTREPSYSCSPAENHRVSSIHEA